MYLTKLKTMLTTALRDTFDLGFPEEDFRNIKIGIEFPIEPQDYPGIWVNYTPAGPVRVAGVGHIEYDVNEAGSASRPFTRWFYSGEASFTIVALTSLERDRLHDELIRVLAFGRENPATSDFRKRIESNEFIACGFDWDAISIRGMSETVGTPWQTDDLIYEVELAMECFGEFISDSQDASLVPLSEVRVTPYPDTDPEPPEDGDGVWQ